MLLELRSPRGRLAVNNLTIILIMGNHSSIIAPLKPEVDKDAAEKKAALESELTKHGFTHDKIDSMLTQVNDLVGCGPVCQREKRVNELQKAVHAAKEQVTQGPTDLRNAQRELMVFKDGQGAYNQEMKEQYAKEAKLVQKNYVDKHVQSLKDTVTVLSENTTSTVYVRNLDEVLETKNKEHKKLLSAVDQNTGVVRTNNRRGEYQSEVTDGLRTAVKYATWAYYLIMVAYFGVVILYRKHYKHYWSWAIFIILLGIPYVIIPTIFNIVSWILSTVGGWMKMHGPKDAYYSL